MLESTNYETYYDKLCPVKFGELKKHTKIIQQHVHNGSTD